jgi:transcriptional regulator with XRE-family HTH domain
MDKVIQTHLGTNSAYKNFAENLMTLATRGTTIAQTCRDLGLNRQQFNKYLSGSVLPNAETMDRLTQHFKIDVLALFSAPKGFLKTEVQVAKSEGRLNPIFENIVKTVQTEKQAIVLAEGVYHFYLPWMHDTSRCVRGIMIVVKRDGFTYFTRLSRYHIPVDGKARWRTIAVDGIAVRENNRLVLYGQKRDETFSSNMVQISMPQYRPNNKFFTGLVSTFDISGVPVARRFAMQRVGSRADWRKYYRKCGLLSFGDASLPSELQILTDTGDNSAKGVLYPAASVSNWQLD